MHAPDIFRDIYLRTAVLLAGGLGATIAALTYLSLSGTDQLIVLYGSGEERFRFLGTLGDVWGMIAVTILIGVLNFSIANAFYRRIRILSYVMGYTTLFFAVLLFVATAAIISTN